MDQAVISMKLIKSNPTIAANPQYTYMKHELLRSRDLNMRATPFLNILSKPFIFLLLKIFV
jgi:hypothetical protein